MLFTCSDDLKGEIYIFWDKSVRLQHPLKLSDKFTLQKFQLEMLLTKDLFQ